MLLFSVRKIPSRSIGLQASREILAGGEGGSLQAPAPRLRCFLCGGGLEIVPSGQTRDFVQRAAKRQAAFVLCPDCFAEMATESVKRERIFSAAGRSR